MPWEVGFRINTERFLAMLPVECKLDKVVYTTISDHNEVISFGNSDASNIVSGRAI